MPLTPSYTYSFNWLQPYYKDSLAQEIPVNLAAGTYAKGTVLGQITSTGANAVQTISTGGTVSGGTFTLTGQAFTQPGVSAVTAALAYNSTAAQIQAALDAIYGVGNTLVSGGPLPGTPVVITFKGFLAAQPVAAITVASSLTGTSPTIAVAQTTPGVGNAGLFKAYASGNGDGSQLPKGLLKYPCTVDAFGNATISGSIPGFTELAVTMYISGFFASQELVGMDSNAITLFGAVISIGTLTSGVIHLG